LKDKEIVDRSTGNLPEAVLRGKLEALLN